MYRVTRRASRGFSAAGSSKPELEPKFSPTLHHGSSEPSDAMVARGLAQFQIRVLHNNSQQVPFYQKDAKVLMGRWCWHHHQKATSIGGNITELGYLDEETAMKP